MINDIQLAAVTQDAFYYVYLRNNNGSEEDVQTAMLSFEHTFAAAYGKYVTKDIIKYLNSDTTDQEQFKRMLLQISPVS